MVLHMLPVAAEDAGVNGPPEPEAAAVDGSGEETEAENSFVFDMQEAASYPERAETDAAPAADNPETSAWVQLQEMIRCSSSIVLSKDAIAAEADTALVVHNINRGLADAQAKDEGYVIKNEGILTIVDSAGKGKITGGNASGDVGGIRNTGTLTFDSVSITGNTCIGSGGGIYNTGTVTMAGGSIAGNIRV